LRLSIYASVDTTEILEPCTLNSISSVATVQSTGHGNQPGFLCCQMLVKWAQPVACAQGQLVFSSSLQWCSYVVCTLLFAPCCLHHVVCTLLFAPCCLHHVVCTMLFAPCCLHHVVCTMLFAQCCQSCKVVCPFVGKTADLVLRDTDSSAFMCLTVTHVVRAEYVHNMAAWQLGSAGFWSRCLQMSYAH